MLFGNSFFWNKKYVTAADDIKSQPPRDTTDISRAYGSGRALGALTWLKDILTWPWGSFEVNKIVGDESEKGE